MKLTKTNKAICMTPGFFLAIGIGLYAFNISNAIYYMFYVSSVFAILSIKFGTVGSILAGSIALSFNKVMDYFGVIEGHLSILNSWTILNMSCFALATILYKEIQNENLLKKIIIKKFIKNEVIASRAIKSKIKNESLESLRIDLYNIAVSLMKFKAYKNIIEINQSKKLKLKTCDIYSKKEEYSEVLSNKDCDDSIFDEEDMAVMRMNSDEENQ